MKAVGVTQRSEGNLLHTLMEVVGCVLGEFTPTQEVNRQ